MDGNRLFPALAPYKTRKLPVDDLHTLYVAEFGRPDGVPIVFLHGGPGSGCRPEQAQMFDPSIFRIILFDQRGAGLSTPKRCVTDNTTAHLVSDLEVIRKTLDVEQWLVVGGSWGSTLAIAYAEAFPDRVTGIILRAVFLGSAEEATWAFKTAAKTFYPDLWRSLCAFFDGAEAADPIAALGARLENPDPRVHKPAARIWNDYERALSTLRPNQTVLEGALYDAQASDTQEGPNTPYIEWHYISHDCFMEPKQLLRDADKLRSIKGIIVQGRYDLLCPPQTAHDLCVAWQNADLRIVADAGHAASEAGIRDALLRAVKNFTPQARGR